MPDLPPEPARGVPRMIAASLLFAAMATFVGAAHQRDPTLSTTVASSMRALVNTAALVVIARGQARVLLGDGRVALWARGVAGAVSLLTYFGALQHLGVGEASFLNQTSAVWVVLLSPWLLGERNPPSVWLAVGGSLLGVALLAAPRAEPADALGRALGLMSGLSAAFAYVSVRAAAQSNGPVAVVFYFTALGSVASLALAWITGAVWPRDPVVLGLLVGAGLAATGAQILMTQAYAGARAGLVAAAGASGPLFTTALGALVLGQQPDGLAGLGMAILGATGIALPLLVERRATEVPVRP